MYNGCGLASITGLWPIKRHLNSVQHRPLNCRGQGWEACGNKEVPCDATQTRNQFPDPFSPKYPAGSKCVKAVGPFFSFVLNLNKNLNPCHYKHSEGGKQKDSWTQILEGCCQFFKGLKLKENCRKHQLMSQKVLSDRAPSS